MELRILLETEIEQASELAMNVFETCLQKTIMHMQSIQQFKEYASADNLRSLVIQGRLIVWGIFEDCRLCAISAMQTEGHISMLYVLPFYQRRGYGRSLLNEMRKFALEQWKKEYVTLNAMPTWTTTFFEKVGFRRIARAQFGLLPYISMEAKTIDEVVYPTKKIREGALIGITFGFLALIFVIAIVFMIFYISQ